MNYRIGLDTSALDVGFKSHALRGIGRYVQELKNYFDSQRASENSASRPKVGYFDHRQFKQQGVISRLIDYLPAGRQTIRQQVVYPLRLGNQKENFDLLHFPAHMDAPAWCVKNYVLTVLDLIPLVLADLYKAHKPSWRFNLARWLEIKAIKNAGLILAISENTARDVHRILGVARDRIIVTPLGVNPNFYTVSSDQEILDLKHKLGIPSDKQIVLYVGGIDPRKNYKGIIESFAILMSIYREKGLATPCLVMAGDNKKDSEYPRLQALINEKSVADNIVQCGYVEDKDLPVLYAASSLLFFPSLYEGFGLTPLESMAAGTAVVSSNTSCMPEVLGDAAMLVNPVDYKACAQTLFDVLQIDELRKKLVESGKKRAAQFTWEKTGELTMQAYEKQMQFNTSQLCVNS